MSPPSGARRRRALVRGRRAEALAAMWLKAKGYRILARGYRIGGGEVDLVARRGRTLVFAEVKYRPTLGEAAHAITAAQRRRIDLAARHFLASHPRLADLDSRFDVILMAPRRLPTHLTDAWRA